MFSDVETVVAWLFGEVSALSRFVWTGSSWVGVTVIGMALLRKVVHIFRKLL